MRLISQILLKRKFHRYVSGMRVLSRLEQIEALGYSLAQSDLPPIVRDWCVGDSVLCLVQGEFEYSDREVWKQLRAFPRDRVLAGYNIFAGLVILDPVYR